MSVKHSIKISKQSIWVGSLLLLLATFFLFLALASDGVYGGADTYWHYLISYYSFEHPELLVDHWGKPLFTILAAPFARAGFFGVQLFNILLSLGSAWLAYGVCKQLKLQYSWLSLLLVLFAPVYFILVFTGLTETLFSFVLILGIWLFFKEKYWLAAIAISFLPFARTEGLVILPLFALAFALRKKWISILLLSTGIVIYSLAGYTHYNDFLWFFTKNPYQGAQDIYGKGSLWHFVTAYREIFGLAFSVLILMGIVAILVALFRQKSDKHTSLTGILLLLLPVVLYFGAHSYLWWRGLNGSLGLVRVMAGIIPPAAVLAVMGLNMLSPWINKYKKTFVALGLILTAIILYEPLALYPLPFPNGPEEKVLDEAAQWIKTKGLGQKRVYSGNAYFFFKMKLDVFDPEKTSVYFPPKDQLSSWTKPGDLCVWDAHFGPNECRLELESLMNNKYFQLMTLFVPEASFITMGGRPYEVYVFQRMTDTTHTNNALILQDLIAGRFVKRQLYLNAFGTSGIFADSVRNNSCFLMKSDVEYSPGAELTLRQCKLESSRNFEISIDVFPIDQAANASIDFVSSVTHGAKTIAYNSFTIELSKLEKNKWNTQVFKFGLPEDVSDEAVFKAYMWNNKKVQAYIDNLKVNYIEENKNK